MKKLLGLFIVILVAVGGAFGIHTITHAKEKERSTIIIGSHGSDKQVWEYIAKSKEAKDLGLKIKVKEISDGVQLNNATQDGSVDVNAFQSYSYFLAYNKQHPKKQLAALGTTYLEPMGIYSEKYKKVADIPNGATIAIANNPAEESRGLLLLQDAGLIKLASDFDALSGTEKVSENPRNLQFKTIDDMTGPRVLKSVDGVLISNSVALDGGLNVLEDSLYHEAVNKETKNNINILTTAEANKNNEKYKKLVELYHESAIQEYVTNEFNGTKVEVNRPISYLK
ncbi:TPA: MetQ/NlpA family ABC transporter substrate-binding protein [Enterococcus faecium]